MMLKVNFLNKIELRKFAIEKRNSMANNSEIKIYSKIICDKIKISNDFINANNVALYLPIKNEIDLIALLDVDNKNFYLPRCNGLNLEFVKYEKNEKLIFGKYNIPEPVGKTINPNILDIIYIPALLANSSCYRLGYGKGYYDRFFERNNIKAKKIIVIPSALVFDEFKQDIFDVKCDSIITENTLF